MSGQIDPTYVDADMARMMRESGQYAETGWYGLDDDMKLQIGPFASEKQCKAACDEANR
jgi:hypothetical protein